MKIAEDIDNLEPSFAKLSDEELVAYTAKFKKAVNDEGKDLREILPQAFAVVREAAKRTLNMRHFKVQLVGGMVLCDGDIAEMKTGEGKTLVATLPAYLHALTGQGVHVVTVNEYLASRDFEWMGRLFNFLGMSVGLNLASMSAAEKRAAYQCDIVFGTNNEFGFDYLRDNMVLEMEKIVQKPLAFAIIDEVDSILIDEARTPLIISGPARASTNTYYVADKLVANLVPEKDFTIDIKTKQVALNDAGVKKVESALNINNLYDIKNIDINHYVQQALKAHAIMHRDQDYVVNEDGVVIVDEFTGRLMHGRRYSDGLHQAIEAKEGLKVQSESMTLATVTLQNYFRLYKKLAGMTGTAKTEEEELRKIYNMRVVQVPTNKSVIRKDLSDVLYRTQEVKYNRVVQEIEERHAKGQPLLVGTVSIENSERLSSLLNKKKIPHEVLNAKNHAREAEIISHAGQASSVTIATNMAGRGTDIVLGEGVANLGGLHVIGTERHESRRIDNQLRGRCGRQGDPGSSQFFLSAEDELIRRFGGDKVEERLKKRLEKDEALDGRFFTKLIEVAQKRVEGHNFDARRWVLRYDNVMNHQREVIYSQRRQVLVSDNLDFLSMERMVKPVINRLTESCIVPLGDVRKKQDISEECKQQIRVMLDFIENTFLPEQYLEPKDLHGLDAKAAAAVIYKKVYGYYQERCNEFGVDDFLHLSRMIILHTVDRKWMDHIDAMEHLRQGIHLRSYGQENPLLAYEKEGLEMFEEMVREIQVEVVRYLFKSQFVEEEDVEQEEMAELPESGKLEGGCSCDQYSCDFSCDEEEPKEK
jgi:preprotein translocase subunit SecA